MVTITGKYGITLSGNAGMNDREIGIVPVSVFAGRGDFARREGGRIRRNERRNRISAKRAFLNGL